MPDPYRYFRVEAGELLSSSRRSSSPWREARRRWSSNARLLRVAHTLKGAARVVKQHGIAERSHAIEELLVPIRDQGLPLAPSTISGALGHVDAMRALLLALAPVAAPVEGSPSPLAGAAEEPFWGGQPNHQDFDALMDGIAELGFQIGGIRRSQGDLERAGKLAEILSDQLAPRRGVQDPASAKLRSLAEDLQSVLERAERELLGGLEQAGRELGQVRDAAERLRLVPAELMWGSLERTARDAAHSLGKRVHFEAHGGDVRLDADLLGLVQRALMQAVRNAVAHGIEAPAERSAGSKPADGAVVIDVQRRDEHVIFSCRDDGRGLDLEAVRRSAQRRGVDAARVAGLDAAGLIELLLQGGISTSSTVTGVAGRGIGLDLVRETADKLGGRVTFQSTPGQGTTIAIKIPVSISALSALLVEVAGQVVAIPLSAVRGTARQLPSEITRSAVGDSVVMRIRSCPTSRCFACSAVAKLSMRAERPLPPRWSKPTAASRRWASTGSSGSKASSPGACPSCSCRPRWCPQLHSTETAIRAWC